MYKLCKTEQSANRQRELEQGLLAAMAVTHYDEISVSDLCDRLGVPRKSFYRYFSDKDGALAALIDHTLMQYEMKNIYSVGVGTEMEHFFKFWLEQKPLLDALQRSGRADALMARAIDYALLEGMGHKPTGSGIMGEREYGILYVVCGLMAMVVRWHHSGYREPVQEMARIAQQLLSRPIMEHR